MKKWCRYAISGYPGCRGALRLSDWRARRDLPTFNLKKGELWTLWNPTPINERYICAAHLEKARSYDSDAAWTIVVFEEPKKLNLKKITL